MKKKRGFTLVEMIAVIGMSAILGALALSLATNLSKSYSITQKENIFQDIARMIHSHIEDDIRVAKEIDTLNRTGIGANVTIGGNNYTIDSSVTTGIEGTFIGMAVKEGGNQKAVAYFWQKGVKKLYRLEANSGETILRPVMDYNDVSDLYLKKTENRYALELKFEDAKGRKDSYTSTIIARNK